MCSLLYYFVIVYVCVTAPVTYECPIENLSDATLQNNTSVSLYTQILNLDSCQIKSVHIDAFRQLLNLIQLTVYNNTIEHLHVGTFGCNLHLTYMNFGANKMHELNAGVFENLVRVTELDLNNNELGSIDVNLFRDMQSLELLNLSGNRIKMLSADTFQTNIKLLRLYLNFNKLENLPKDIFNNLKLLQYLYISKNHLTGINKELFCNLSTLTLLDISNNFIRTIETDTFNYNEHLREIYLHHNLISSIEPGALIKHGPYQNVTLYANKLLYLAYPVIENLKLVPVLPLYDNPWLCDCRLKPLHDIWQSHSDDINEPRCAGPDKLINRTWSAISADDLCLYTITATVGDNISFTCQLSGDRVQWIYGKNVINRESKSASGEKYSIDSATSMVTISNIQSEDKGWYMCQPVGSSEKNKFLLIPSIPEPQNDWQIFGYVSPVLLFILAIAFVVLLVKHYKYKTKPSAEVHTLPLRNMPQSEEQPYASLYEEIAERRDDPDEDGYMVTNDIYR